MRIALTISVVFVLLGAVISEECNDCVEYDKCPAAVNLMEKKRDAATRELFLRAYCGLKSKPMVCCSMFSPAVEAGTGTNNDATTAHKNLGLLPTKCGVITNNRLLGGNGVLLNEFPWGVLIAYQTANGMEFQCEGTLINQRYVLTAANCVKNKRIAGVRVGEYDISSDVDCQGSVCQSEGVQDLRVELSIVHDNYSVNPRIVNDIALLRLQREVNFTYRNAGPICLPTVAKLLDESLDNQIGEIFGWGPPEGTFTTPHKYAVTVQNCRNFIDRFDSPGHLDAEVNQICSSNNTACNGVSGSPLMLVKEVNNFYRYVLYGVTSHGLRQCGLDYPAVFTDIRKYIPWVLDNIAP